MRNDKFVVGVEVEYQHGRGPARGKIVEVVPAKGSKPAKAVIETKNGKQAVRPISRLALAPKEAQ